MCFCKLIYFTVGGLRKRKRCLASLPHHRCLQQSACCPHHRTLHGHLYILKLRKVQFHCCVLEWNLLFFSETYVRFKIQKIRYLYYLADESSETLAEWMNTFESTGSLNVPLEALDRAKQEFSSFSSDRNAIIQVELTPVRLPVIVFVVRICLIIIV